jgi:hypothetical protein
MDKFHLHTDHSALTWLLSFKNLEGQTTRWIQRLREFSFTSEHCQGWKHMSADALSWQPCQEECTHCHKVKAWADIKQVRAVAAGWDLATLRMEQLNDPDIQEVETGQRLEWKDIGDRRTTCKTYWAKWKSLTVRKGILEHKSESANGRSQIAQIVFPQSRIKGALTELHSGSSGGHLGVNKTPNKVRQW